MKISQDKIRTALALTFGLLSLFSVWNIYNWDFLGWGSKLFLFPFLAVIALMAKLSPKTPKWASPLQLGLLVLHGFFYFWIFNFQDPHAPNLLLLLVPMLLSTTLLIWSKNSVKAVYYLLGLAACFYLLMGLLANQNLLTPGIVFEVLGLLLYLGTRP